MFEDKKITIEKVKELVCSIQTEYENELDYDYAPKYKQFLKDDKSKTFEELDIENKTYTSEEVMCIMDGYLNQFTDKLFNCIDDELK